MIDIKEFSNSIIQEEYFQRFGEAVLADFDDQDIEDEFESRHLDSLSSMSDEQISDEFFGRGLTGEDTDSDIGLLAYKIRNKMNLGQDTKTDVRDLIELLTRQLVVS